MYYDRATAFKNHTRRFPFLRICFDALCPTEALRERDCCVHRRIRLSSTSGTLSRYMYSHTLCNMHHTLSLSLPLSSFGSFAQSGSSPGEPPSRGGKDTIGRMLEPGPIETRIPLKFLDQKSKEREEWKNFDKERAAVHLALPDKLIKSTTIVIMVVTIIIEIMVEYS